MFPMLLFLMSVAGASASGFIIVGMVSDPMPVAEVSVISLGVWLTFTAVSLAGCGVLVELGKRVSASAPAPSDAQP